VRRNPIRTAVFSVCKLCRLGKVGGFTANLNLSSLNGANGFQNRGVSAYDYAGRSVSGAGDVNGDGFDDLIIGAPGVDSNRNEYGACYFGFWEGDGFAANLNLSTLNGANGVKLSGVRSTRGSNVSVSAAGDVNHDGFDDVIIGQGVSTSLSSSYVVFGKSSGFGADFDLANLNGYNGFRVSGASISLTSAVSVSNGRRCQWRRIWRHCDRRRGRVEFLGRRIRDFRQS
jgi:hypothetical protein